MSPLEKIKEWLATYPGHDILSDFQVDYTDQIKANGGVFPSGLEEISRVTDICGNTTVENQYNFGLYYVFEKAPGDDTGATINADWIMGFQEWVQVQSVAGDAPVFGDIPSNERIVAQNGVMYDVTDEGLATYMVQLSVRFVRKFSASNPWFASATTKK